MELKRDLIEPAFDLVDFSIGNYTGEELRRICQEAIATGKAYERKKKRLKYALCAAVIAVVSVAALSVAILR